MVRETIRRIEQPFATPTGIEVLLRDLPDFVLQLGKSIFGEVNEFAMEGLGTRIPFSQPSLELIIRLWHLTFRGRLTALVLGREFRVANLVLFLCLAFALLKPTLQQNVVDHADDRVAQLSQVIAVQGDLRIGPQLVEITRING